MSRPTLEPWSDEILPVLSRMLETVVAALPRVGVAALVLLLGWSLARLLRWVLRRWLTGRRTPSFTNVMSTLARWVVLVVAALAAVTIVFPSVRPVDLLAGLGFFSIAVGFAFQDILENTLSGVLMLLRQPFRSGDQIEVQGHTGTVQAITIRETRIRTFDGQLLVIPNRDVYKSVIRVQTHFDRRRLSFVVGVAYENDPAEAADVIVTALSEVEGVLEAPPPEALVQVLGVSTVDLEARFWTVPQQHESQQVLHRAVTAVKSALDAAGIEMPAEIIALQATPSFRAALHGDAEVTPGGAVRRSPGT
ncbi:mechanosensitive ion channel [Phycicoccus sp. CSK15P-2]|uniref:mechanosensitive ion channel family protein n=1 Tax=Phycicoccus sp. CSK15P-2 TaxID=2807627 RepID=UPI001951BE6F|nr:mechanosensitive ion channel [Phycicoccus sp. CSK15P-2]MBM6402864.1 mechanosensitive ion channel [Phycicoccus sp. CSK15P-2]